VTCAYLVLLALLRLAPWYQDVGDSFQARSELYYPVAVAICAVASNDTERAFLAWQAYQETRLARYVLEERCHDGPPGVRCDAGLATGPWQMHAWCTGAWTGTQQARLEAGARHALRLARRCRTPEGWFAAQSGRASCSAPWARQRVPGFWRMLEKVRER
jgi:hypothetical protein